MSFTVKCDVCLLSNWLDRVNHCVGVELLGGGGGGL